MANFGVPGLAPSLNPPIIGIAVPTATVGTTPAPSPSSGQIWPRGNPPSGAN